MTYGYLRVSTDKQDENNQRFGVDDKAKKMGIGIDEYIIDSGVSGTKEPEKRKLGALLAKLKSGDTIIASELSRLGRSLYMVMRILENCMNLGVRVITVKDNYELGDNISSKVLAFAFSLSAEIERDMISQRTKEALQKKQKEGMIIGRPRGSRNGCTKLKPHHKQIIEYLKSGYSYSKIGRALNVRRYTVTNYCLQNNLTQYHSAYHGRGAKAIQQTPVLDKIARLYDLLRMIRAGMSYAEIGKKYGVSEASVRVYVQRKERLHKAYVETHNKIRIKANGGLKINKRYEGN